MEGPLYLLAQVQPTGCLPSSAACWHLRVTGILGGGGGVHTVADLGLAVLCGREKFLVTEPAAVSGPGAVP